MSSTSSNLSPTLSAITVLPNELLVYVLGIVIFAGSPPFSTFNRRRVDCSAICQFWRNLVLAQAQFWTWLVIERDSRVEFLDLCLSRAGNDAPLSIEVAGSPRTSKNRRPWVGMDIGPIIPLDTYLEMLTTMFMSRAHRVRRIEIRAQVFAEWDAVFQTFASFSLSALQEVASSIDTCTYWGQRYGKIEHCVWGLPLRAQLKQVFPVFADTTLFSHLLDLKLDTISLDDTTLFLPALKSAVSLERLCARSVIVPSPMDNVIVELPALQRFTIYAAQDTALAWLACLSLPAVTYFSADLAYDDASSALHVSCKQFLSRVRKLDYHTSSTDIGTPDVWRDLEAVEEISGTWSVVGSRELERLLAEGNYPNLRDVHFSHSMTTTSAESLFQARAHLPPIAIVARQDDDDGWHQQQFTVNANQETVAVPYQQGWETGTNW